MKKQRPTSTEYLCAYYWLRRKGKFRNAAIHFPSHIEIYNEMISVSGQPHGTPLDACMDIVGAGYSSTDLQIYRNKKRKKNKLIHQVVVVNTTKPRMDSASFYASDAWKTIRYKALEINGGACQCCGRTRKHGVILHVDHIKPRSLHPELELRIDNLQVLCEDCNLGKSNKFSTDWR